VLRSKDKYNFLFRCIMFSLLHQVIIVRKTKLKISRHSKPVNSKTNYILFNFLFIYWKNPRVIFFTYFFNLVRKWKLFSYNSEGQHTKIFPLIIFKTYLWLEVRAQYFLKSWWHWFRTDFWIKIGPCELPLRVSPGSPNT